MYSNYDLYREHEPLIDQAINFFLAEATNPELFDQIRIVCSERDKQQTGGKLDGIIKMGYLSVNDFFWYMNDTNQIGKGLKLQILDFLLKLLEEKTIILRLESMVNKGNLQSFKVNLNLAKYLNERGLIKNAIFGFPYIIERYSKSVFKIEVINKYGEPSIGTGFLFRIRKNDGVIIATVITNKHVIEKAASFKVLNKTDDHLTHLRVFSDDSIDIAIIELNDRDDFNTFHIYPEVKELNDIITIGYPSIPMTKEAYQVYHKGEINSHVEDYGGNKFFLFSAKTSSGNSGSPVINSFGMVVGMVTEELFDEHLFFKKGKLPYYAAVPGSEIIDFFNNVYLPKV